MILGDGSLNKRLTTEQLKKYIESQLPDLIKTFNERNAQYSATELGTSNFVRNADYNRVFRIKEIIDEPFGVSIHYTLQKIDRLISGIVLTLGDGRIYTPHRATYYKTMSDSIDDAIIYLLITKALLKEEGLLE